MRKDETRRKSPDRRKSPTTAWMLGGALPEDRRKNAERRAKKPPRPPQA